MESVAKKASKKAEGPKLWVEGIYLRDVQVVRFEGGVPVYLPGYEEASRLMCAALLRPRLVLPAEVADAAD